MNSGKTTKVTCISIFLGHQGVSMRLELGQEWVSLAGGPLPAGACCRASSSKLSSKCAGHVILAPKMLTNLSLWNRLSEKISNLYSRLKLPKACFQFQKEVTLAFIFPHLPSFACRTPEMPDWILKEAAFGGLSSAALSRWNISTILLSSLNLQLPVRVTDAFYSPLEQWGWFSSPQDTWQYMGTFSVGTTLGAGEMCYCSE